MSFINLAFIFSAKYLIFVMGGLALYWFSRMERTQQEKMATFAFVSLPLTYVLGLIGSALYYDPRPFVTGGIIPLISHAANNGFPSDHALAAFALTAVFFAFDHKKAKILFVLAAIVAFARVLVGVHHYLDVEAGLVFALLGWYLTKKIFRYYKNHTNTKLAQ